MIGLFRKFLRFINPFRSRPKGPLYQYYAQVHYLTCEECLKRHGEIFSESDKQPPIHEDCRCDYLEIPPEDLSTYRSKSERMKEIAETELERREILNKAISVMDDNREEALELFKEAADREVYLGEIEDLLREKGDLLKDNPDFTSQLRQVFVKYYKWKYGKRRYEKWPELMRIQREKAGVKRINDLFRELKG